MITILGLSIDYDVNLSITDNINAMCTALSVFHTIVQFPIPNIPNGTPPSAINAACVGTQIVYNSATQIFTYTPLA